ncbi:MAG: major capsid protein [Gammaproteobacteria bacterium]|nr:major capsid protein [Gammaproteobacteria bacterium]
MTIIVTNPTAGDVHVNVPLTNFSQKYLQNADAFVATRAFPNLPVTKQSDLYYVFDRDDFYRDEAAERADGTESEGGSFDLSTDPYFARVYAFHKDVTDRQRANQDTPVQLDNSATQFVTHKLLIRRERVFQSQFFADGIWTHGNAAPSPLWSAATGDPINDIRDAKRTVQEATGYRPNKLLLGRQAYDTLIENDLILARIAGGATNNTPAIVMRQLLAQLFELDAIYVMDGIYTSSVKGAATTTRAFIGGDNALLYYAPDTVGLNEPTAGVQLSWTGLLGNTANGMRIRRFRNEATQADRIEGEMSFDYRRTGADLGFFWNGVSG